MLKRIKSSFFADSIALLGSQRLRICTLWLRNDLRFHKKLVSAPASMLAFNRNTLTISVKLPCFAHLIPPAYRSVLRPEK